MLNPTPFVRLPPLIPAVCDPSFPGRLLITTSALAMAPAMANTTTLVANLIMFLSIFYSYMGAEKPIFHPECMIPEY